MNNNHVQTIQYIETAKRITVTALLLATALLVLATLAHAQENAPRPGGEMVPDEVLSAGEEQGDTFEEKQKEWSERVSSTATYMDEFFDNEQYKETVNKTYVRLRITPRYNKDGFSVDNFLDVRLKLPKAEKWLVSFGGDPDDEERYGSTPLEDAERESSGRDEGNSYVGASTFLKESRTRNINTGGGVRFRSRKIVPFVSGRWVELWEFDNWDIRLTERLRVYTDTGLELKNQLDFDWPIAHKFFARTSGAMTLEPDQEDYYFDITYTLYQYLTTRRALKYKILTGYEHTPTRSTYLKTAKYEIEYRQQWRNWFYTSITPQVVQSDNNDWKADPGIRLDFNFIFGYTSDYKFESQFSKKQKRNEKRSEEELQRQMKEFNQMQQPQEQ